MNPTDYSNSISYGQLPSAASRNPSARPQNPPANPFLFPENLSNALQLIQQAVMGETEDRMFYTYLIENAPTMEEKELISGIRDDEIKHYAMFHQLYRDITGKEIPNQTQEAFVPPETYCDGLKHALLGEQNAVRKYRQILYAMQPRVHINRMVEIITDEIRHGSLYNYMYAKNGCSI